MAKKYGIAGKSTWDMAERRKRRAYAYAGIGIIIFLLFAFILLNPKQAGVGGIGILIALFGIKVLPDILDGVLGREIKSQKRAERGAVGEERTGEILEDLGEDFVAIHDVVSPFGNIDHIVISKEKGIFLIETKSHRGRVDVVDGEIMLNGHPPEKDFVAQTLKNTYWLRDEIIEATGLQLWIHPIILFTNAFVVSRKPIKGIRVINKKYLKQAIDQTLGENVNNRAWVLKDMIIANLT